MPRRTGGKGSASASPGQPATSRRETRPPRHILCRRFATPRSWRPLFSPADVTLTKRQGRRLGQLSRERAFKGPVTRNKKIDRENTATSLVREDTEVRFCPKYREQKKRVEREADKAPWRRPGTDSGEGERALQRQYFLCFCRIS